MTYQSTDLPTISDEYGTSDFEGQLVYDKVTYYVKGDSTLEIEHEEKDERGNTIFTEDNLEIIIESIHKGEDFEEEVDLNEGIIEAELLKMLYNPK
jgi:hypothetical protein